MLRNRWFTRNWNSSEPSLGDTAVAVDRLMFYKPPAESGPWPVGSLLDAIDAQAAPTIDEDSPLVKQRVADEEEKDAPTEHHEEEEKEAEDTGDN